MVIRRNAWHYRLHNLVWTTFDLEHYGPLAAIRGRRANHEPKSLCSYFWSTALLLVVMPGFLIALGTFALAAGVLIVITWPFLTIKSRREATRIARGEPPRQSLVATYVRAKKQRVCPRITLV